MSRTLFEAGANEPAFIPPMNLPHIKCIGAENLEFIGARFGNRFEEGDVERLDDKYGWMT